MEFSPVPLKKIIDYLNTDIISISAREDFIVTGFSSLSKTKFGSMSFLSKYNAEINYDFNTYSLYLLPDLDIEIRKRLKDINIIFVKNPRLTFIRCLNKFFQAPKKEGIHPTAIIGDNVKIGKFCYIGPYCIVDKNCSIGDYSILYSSVHLYGQSTIGNYVTIHSGAIIGADGFGYQKNDHGEFEKFPHWGGVFIDDNVEIGAKTCIDRGTLDDTYIGANTKIDNLVHIAHNVHIGKNCMVVALAMIGGSAKIGNQCWIGPSSSIRDGLIIGDNALIGMGANVVKNVAQNVTVAGNPAKPM